jgi:NADH dehydrogenase
MTCPSVIKTGSVSENRFPDYGGHVKVLVTGGTGFIGTALVKALVRNGHQVVVFSRGFKDPQRSVEWVQGSVLDRDRLRGALAGCDAAIHLVGIISEIGDQTFERMHVEATRNVVDSLHWAGVRRLVHMSALGARPDAPARYHSSKAAAEALVRSSGLDWTIFRPSLVYGPGDAFVNLFDWISKWSPIVPVMGPGTNLLQPVAVEFVAEAFATALNSTPSLGQTIDLCGPDRLSFRALIQRILAARGRTRWVLSIPWPLARLQARMMEWLFPTLLRKAPPLNRDQLLMLHEDNVGDPAPALQLLEGNPVVARFPTFSPLERT